MYSNGLSEETSRPLEHPQTETGNGICWGVVFLHGVCAMVLSILMKAVLRLEVCSIKKVWYNLRLITFGEHSCIVYIPLKGIRIVIKLK